MADKEISAIAAAAKLDGTEQFHVIQGGNSRRVLTADMAGLGVSLLTDATTARVMVATDAGKWLRFTNGAAITATFNTAVFTAGDEIMFEQVGLGAVTFTAGAGFTLRSAGGLIISNGQNSVQGIKFITSTDAILFGNLV